MAITVGFFSESRTARISSIDLSGSVMSPMPAENETVEVSWLNSTVGLIDLIPFSKRSFRPVTVEAVENTSLAKREVISFRLPAEYMSTRKVLKLSFISFCSKQWRINPVLPSLLSANKATFLPFRMCLQRRAVSFSLSQK